MPDRYRREQWHLRGGLDNVITGSVTCGVSLCDCYGVDVSTNTIGGGQDGVLSAASSSDDIEHNIIENTYNGVDLSCSQEEMVQWNVVNASANFGLKVIGCEYINVENNIIENSTSYGAYFNTSLNNVVTLNRFIDNNGAGAVYDRTMHKRTTTVMSMWITRLLRSRAAGHMTAMWPITVPSGGR